MRPGEQPGAVLKGPPITLTCECGEKHDLPYGERWECESCGRIWDTEPDPAPSSTRRSASSACASACCRSASARSSPSLAVFFTLTGNVFSVFFLLPVALTTLVRLPAPAPPPPLPRGGQRSLPRWELRAE